MTEDIGPFQKPTMDMNTGRPQEGPRSSTWKDFSFFWPTVTVLFIHILSLSPIYLYLSICLSVYHLYVYLSIFILSYLYLPLLCLYFLPKKCTVLTSST